MRHVIVNGGGLNVLERGERGGPVVVFVNSLGTDSRVWDGVVERLPSALNLLRMDKRGHGLSTLEPTARTVEAHAADLAGVLDTLDARRALVVGLSIGGLIAQMLAVTRPDCVSGLLLLDTAQRIGTPESWNVRIDAVRAGGMASIADGVMERWFSTAFRRDRGDVVEAWRILFSRMPAEGYVAACEAVRDADLTALARRIAVPTRFAVGAEDVATPPDLVRLAAERVPGARFSLIDEAGHLPPVEQPDAVAALVRAQLGEVDRA
jgi:3-oxoadipate enol-lactonase